uniref:Uncharacterized protein n=1 Tax=Anguilla anguilla TaxID=7936 RepID=A0A0E9Q6Z0_ANGAN
MSLLLDIHSNQG